MDAGEEAFWRRLRVFRMEAQKCVANRRRGGACRVGRDDGERSDAYRSRA